MFALRLINISVCVVRGVSVLVHIFIVCGHIRFRSRLIYIRVFVLTGRSIYIRVGVAVGTCTGVVIVVCVGTCTGVVIVC